MTRSPRLRLLLAALLLLGLGTPSYAEDPDGGGVPDAVRRSTIKKLGRQIRRKARSARAPREKEEILEMLASVEVLGGPEAGEAALEAVALADEQVRDRAFGIAETFHDESLVPPLGELLEDKLFRQDEDLRGRVARSLSIMAHESAVPHLTGLVRTDEYPKVVAAAADSLATYGAAPLEMRKEAVRRLIDVYTTTWNLMMSVRPEDKVIGSKMREHWKIYGSAVRSALQALTGEQSLTRPQEWREWWNDHKKRTDW